MWVIACALAGLRENGNRLVVHSKHGDRHTGRGNMGHWNEQIRAAEQYRILSNPECLLPLLLTTGARNTMPN